MIAPSRQLADAVLVVCSWTAVIVETRVITDRAVPLPAHLLAGVIALALVARHRAPVPVLFTVATGSMVFYAAYGGWLAKIAVVMIALYQVALLGGRRRSAGFAVLACLSYVATTWLVDRSLPVTATVSDLLLLLTALLVGDTVRVRRRLRTIAEEQREQETTRRVTEERLRIARELHDTLGHALVAINVRAGVAAHLGSREDPAAALLDIEQTSHDALNDLRATLQLLREPDEEAPTAPPVMTSDLAGLSALADRLRAAGLDVRLDVRSGAVAVPAPVEQACFRIVQEALTNVLRHAGVPTVDVVVRVDGGHLDLDVTDEGRGGSVPAARDGDAPGHGLRGMDERAAAVGGWVRAGPRTGGGWHVAARLPLFPRA